MRTVTVKGIGKIARTPDEITLSITLAAHDMDYTGAMSKAAGQHEELKNTITPVGFTAEELKTTDFSVTTEFDNRPNENGIYERVFTGYACRHELRLRFALDNERLSAVIAALSACPAAPEFMITYGVRDGETVKAELLRNAVRSARLNAEVLCAASDVGLGELVSIDYTRSDIDLCSPTQYRNSKSIMRSVRETCVMDMTPEDITASDTVTCVWEIA